MAHSNRRMTPLYLLNEERKKLDAIAEKQGVSRQKVLEEIIHSGIRNLKQSGPLERRKTQKRLKTTLQIYFGPTKEIILSGFSVDISAGGLFLQTTYPFQTNDEMRLIFTLPDQEKPISCDAKVAWTNTEGSGSIKTLPVGVGLEFNKLSLENIMAISKFIEDSGLEGGW